MKAKNLMLNERQKSRIQNTADIFKMSKALKGQTKSETATSITSWSQILPKRKNYNEKTEGQKRIGEGDFESLK